MVKITSLAERLGELIREGTDPAAAARQVLDEIPKTRLIDMLMPTVTNLARSIRRAQTRTIERRAFAPPPAPTRHDARLELVAAGFVLPDGRYVTWGQATRDDHLARAEWQHQHAADSIRDAARHELAAKLLDAAGAACLDELGDWSALLDRALTPDGEQ